ncbi:MAG: 50S ribosomal protein L10, partial [Bacteroidota bacterium]|nr:50S ribosomal protein L10 [Bacteroidota bacterium]
MRREEKADIINSLAATLQEYSHFYLTDTAELNAADTSDLRRKCF